MKKLLTLLVSFALVFAVGATTPSNKVSDLTTSAASTGDNYDSGAEYVVYGTHTTTAVITNGTTLAIAKIPGQSRILSSEIQFAASATTSTNTIGLIAVDGTGYYSLDGSTDADDTDYFLTLSTQSAVGDSFSDMSNNDSNCGEVVEKDVYIVIDGTSGSAAYPTNKAISWVIRYTR